MCVLGYWCSVLGYLWRRCNGACGLPARAVGQNKGALLREKLCEVRHEGLLR